MHSYGLALVSTGLRWISIALAVGAILCGTQLEYRAHVARWRAPSRPDLPNPRHLTPRGRRYYRAVFLLAGLTALAQFLAWLVDGFNRNAG